MCIILSALMEINLVSGMECAGGFNKGTVSACTKDIAGYEQYDCQPKKCDYAGHFWVPMNNWVLYASKVPGISSQQCEEYNYLNEDHYTCWNHQGVLYSCQHKWSDRPVMTCEDSACVDR
ncbi:secreted protein [Melampsora americana]|nr:secreted protein [Melampsora americana]